jgi:hypothetical protein
MARGWKTARHQVRFAVEPYIAKVRKAIQAYLYAEVAMAPDWVGDMHTGIDDMVMMALVLLDGHYHDPLVNEIAKSVVERAVTEVLQFFGGEAPNAPGAWWNR